MVAYVKTANTTINLYVFHITLSVVLQVGFYKLTHGKRIFLMSPIHHHFEKKGYSETQIVSMYAGITLILSLIAILSII